MLAMPVFCRGAAITKCDTWIIFVNLCEIFCRFVHDNLFICACFSNSLSLFRGN